MNHYDPSISLLVLGFRTMDKKKVVVTGSGSGIGQGIAQAFLDQGHVVYASDISEARLEESKKNLQNTENLRTHVADVSNHDELTRLAERVLAEGGSIDVWVNCAGIFDGYADVLETTPDLWQKILDINLSGAFYGCRVAADAMIKQKSGRIITIGSVAGQRGAADGIAYAASKAGIEGMTRRLAVDVARHGITANVIAPGVIKTNLRTTSQEILGDLTPSQERGIGTSSKEFLDALIPAQRAGEISEIAAVATFLGSEGAAYVNGQVIAVDGGWTAG